MWVEVKIMEVQEVTALYDGVKILKIIFDTAL